VEDQPLPPEDWRVPSTRLRSLRRAQLAAWSTLLFLAGLAAALAAGDAVVGAYCAGAILVLAAGADGLIGRRVRAWGYTERADDLLVRRGVMFRRLSVIPYGRMQFVDVTAGPFERAFGLATVRMHTAAAASDARIPGLSAVDAAALRDHLAALGESQLAGL
jgi:membrane protein YdbS with pleckstrin-like domain